MTVKELISELNKLPCDYNIFHVSPCSNALEEHCIKPKIEVPEHDRRAVYIRGL